MNVHDTINHWITQINPCNFFNEVMGEVLDPPIDQRKDNKTITEAYRKIHGFIRKNQKFLINTDADLVNKLADHINLMGLQVKCLDSKVQKIYSLAHQLRVMPGEEEIKKIRSMPTDIRKIIFSYAVTTPEEILKELIPEKKSLKDNLLIFITIIQELKLNKREEEAELLIQAFCDAVRVSENAENMLTLLLQSILNFANILFLHGDDEKLFFLAEAIEQIVNTAPPRAEEKEYQKGLQSVIKWFGSNFLSKDFINKYAKS